MTYIHENFLLTNDVAIHLYHTYAKKLPIIDYHCHLKPEQIAEEHQYENLAELWLQNDHYKWRAMRANGVDEPYITGNKSAEEKLKAWLDTVEASIGNPLYHWTHMELTRYFDVYELCNSKNFEIIWQKSNDKLGKSGYTVNDLITKSNVEIICTTDQPLSALTAHKKIATKHNFMTTVLPTFRADIILKVGTPEHQNFIDELAQKTTLAINSYTTFIQAIEQRMLYFSTVGCKLSDIAIPLLFFASDTTVDFDELFRKSQTQKLTIKEIDILKTKILIDFAKLNHKLDWTLQIHFGTQNNVNTRLFQTVGANAGFDSIHDQANISYYLNHFLDALDITNQVPKIIFYNLNSSKNNLIANIIGGFQTTPGIKSKIQFGTAWWFNDTKTGMLDQLDTLANNGLLMNFVGMLTDSRSFLSYTRHEYFRRILCQYVGEKVTSGEYPNDETLLKKLIENICYYNAKKYFNFKIKP